MENNVFADNVLSHSNEWDVDTWGMAPMLQYAMKTAGVVAESVHNSGLLIDGLEAFQKKLVEAGMRVVGIEHQVLKTVWLYAGPTSYGRLQRDRDEETFFHVASCDPTLTQKLLQLTRESFKPMPRPAPKPPTGFIQALVQTRVGLSMQQIGLAGLPLERGNYAPEAVEKFDFVQRDLRARNPRGRITILSGCPGGGKCLGLGTPVMKHDGTIVAVEDVRVGDLLMGPDSKPRRVLSTTRDRGPLYRVTPVKGMSWVCNDVHVLTLTGTRGKAGEIIDIPLNEHLANCAEKGCEVDRDWKLFRVGVEFPRQEVRVEPYLLGLWLGDGSSDATIITNREPEIIAYCEDAAQRHGVQVRVKPEERNNTSQIAFFANGRGEKGPRKANVLREVFDSCVVDGEKRIPVEYLRNSRENRLELLAGILDTDGYLSNGHYDICFKPKGLAEQVLYLARSLGLAAYMTEKTSSCPTPSGTFTGTYYRVSISGDLDQIPCKVERRKASPRKQIKRANVTGFGVDPIGDGEYAGFELDGDGRFLLGDFTVTHNTHMLRALLMTPGIHFVLIPADLVPELSGPKLLPVLLENRGSFPMALVIEDGDALVSTRTASNMSAISSLLNMGDGMLGSLTDLRILITTNAKTMEFDEAIRRPGRLSAHIEVGALKAEHATGVLRRLVGTDKAKEYAQARTLAEVYADARDLGWAPPEEPETKDDDENDD